ncbi:MAG: MFS transporter [Caldilineae bacterium]|nr:MAG: MFS transporter [Caldilineae bacterium]
MSYGLAGWSRALVRRLLEIDRPVQEQSEAELEAQMLRDYPWNFTVNFLDGAFFWLGLSFASSVTILPLFVSKLSDNPFLIALVAILGQASWYLPQLFTAGVIESVPRKKPFVVNVGFFTERLPMWLLPVAALASLRSPTLALVLFFLAYAAHGLGAGLIAPAWSDMLARCFPVNKRGRFFGVTSFVGTGLGALGAVLSGWILAHYPFPTNFVYLFLLAAVTITISWGFIALTREPVYPVPAHAARRVRGGSRRKMMSILRGDHNFRRFLAARLLSSLAAMGGGFLTVAAVQRWQLSDSTVGLFTAAMLVGQTAGNLAAGLVADRWGHKLSLETGLIAITGGFVLAWLAPDPSWYFVVFFLFGASAGIRIVSGVLIPLEFARPNHRPTYVGLSNTTMGVGSALAPLVGGLLAEVGYNWLFAASALVGVLALSAMHWAVTEPRHQTELFEPDVEGVAL